MSTASAKERFGDSGIKSRIDNGIKSIVHTNINKKYMGILLIRSKSDCPKDKTTGGAISGFFKKRRNWLSKFITYNIFRLCKN